MRQTPSQLPVFGQSVTMEEPLQRQSQKRSVGTQTLRFQCFQTMRRFIPRLKPWVFSPNLCNAVCGFLEQLWRPGIKHALGYHRILNTPKDRKTHRLCHPWTLLLRDLCGIYLVTPRCGDPHTYRIAPCITVAGSLWSMHAYSRRRRGPQSPTGTARPSHHLLRFHTPKRGAFPRLDSTGVTRPITTASGTTFTISLPG